MGKAAIIIVPILFVVCALVLVGGVSWIAKLSDGPSGKERKHKVLAEDAAKLFQVMLIPRDINNMDILTDDSRKEITKWINKYRKVNG